MTSYFKFQKMFDYLGIKAEILNPRAELIFDGTFNYQGFYLRYLNLETNTQELAKLSVDLQESGYKEIKEIYKEPNTEKAKTLKTTISKVLGTKLKDTYVYASYPVVKKDQEIISLRNFEMLNEPDKYYFDVSSAKESNEIYSFLNLDEKLIKPYKDKINFILQFDAETLEKLGLFYMIFGTKSEIMDVLKNAEFIKEITDFNKVQSAFETLVEQNSLENPSSTFYTLGIQKSYSKPEMTKFVFTAVKDPSKATRLLKS